MVSSENTNCVATYIEFLLYLFRLSMLSTTEKATEEALRDASCWFPTEKKLL